MRSWPFSARSRSRPNGRRPAEPVASCRLRRACPYPRLFETFLEPDATPPFLRGVKTAPRPYVFEPTGGEAFAPGDLLRFDLLLFGQAVALQAYALVAVERMAEAGLEKGRASLPQAGAGGGGGGDGREVGACRAESPADPFEICLDDRLKRVRRRARRAVQ